MSNCQGPCQCTPVGLQLRSANKGDAALLCDFIKELAEFEGLANQCFVTPSAIFENLLGSRRVAAAIIAEVDGKPVGFAVYYRTFSTFAAKPGIFIEDLYVRPDSRGKGIGRTMLKAIAQIAQGRMCGRLEWTALNWNEKALKLYADIGAKEMNEWKLLRLEGEGISKLAGPVAGKSKSECNCGGGGCASGCC
jgi:GNAT superfamily N-acetyltransferase